VKLLAPFVTMPRLFFPFGEPYSSARRGEVNGEEKRRGASDYFLGEMNIGMFLDDLRKAVEISNFRFEISD